MANSWGHNVRPLTEQEIESQINYGKRLYQFELEHHKEREPNENKCIHYYRKCRISKKCQNESTHMLTYRYVTGRAGRTSFAEKPICEHHAKKYLVNNE
jgi:hypothetical protein